MAHRTGFFQRAALFGMLGCCACHHAGSGGAEQQSPPIPGLDAGVAPNRDSAQITVVPVASAFDYRAFALPATMTNNADGTEGVSGTTIYCAGLVQHDAPIAPAEVLPTIEINGMNTAADVVVEALDRPCPFPGMIAAEHHDINVTSSEVEAAAQGVFSLFSEAEVTAAYGALIINGQGAASKVAQAAPPSPPKILARSTVHIVPTGNGAPLTATFFDDFSDASDQPRFVKAEPGQPPYHDQQNGQLWQNSKWSIYSYGSHHFPKAGSSTDENTFHPFISRGALQMVLADWEQEIFSSAIAYPRQPVHLSASSYLHVTYEVQSDSSERRYWEILLCGADQAGQTMDANGQLMGDIIQTPFFFDNDGLDPSVQGWNCFQIFVRGGWPVSLPPSDTNPESDVRVMVNLPDKSGADVRSSVVNVSPDQILQSYPGQTALGAPSWYRQETTNRLTAPMMDDALTIGVRQKFDLWLRRDRSVLFVNGHQRLCNDFPTVPLTMHEAALGFAQFLYHSSAERSEFNVTYWVRSGQRYYLDDAPFVDGRTWDNLGYEENMAAPPGLDESACFTYAPP